ncbi:MAG: DUF2304 domain-containing protein [Lachnospiraceae bacterium]|nr:DUF2304 domain-containing protein [Lachnospiraceae bacterium]
MTVGDILRIFMVIVGVVLLWTTISSLAKRKMTETVCLVWGLVSVVCVLSGILLRPYSISEYISMTGLFLIMIIGIAVLYGAFFISTKLSELARKNHELAVQVSLLNHENRMMIEKLELMEEKLKDKAQVED